MSRVRRLMNALSRGYCQLTAEVGTYQAYFGKCQQINNIILKSWDVRRKTLAALQTGQGQKFLDTLVILNIRSQIIPPINVQQHTFNDGPE